VAAAVVAIAITVGRSSGSRGAQNSKSDPLTVLVIAAPAVVMVAIGIAVIVALAVTVAGAGECNRGSGRQSDNRGHCCCRNFLAHIDLLSILGGCSAGCLLESCVVNAAQKLEVSPICFARVLHKRDADDVWAKEPPVVAG
jgi:hypothetical protein